MENQTRKPKAVLISDIHYNIQTLPVADAALRQAVDKANDLKIPLIIAGDLHDTKANIRGECIKAIRDTLKHLHMYDSDEQCESPLRNCYILRGNHDSINEKSAEHSLHFLEDLAYIITKPYFYNSLGGINGRSIHLIPYHHDPDELRKYLKKVDKGSCLIMHQGIEGSNSGDYIQDKSAIHKEDAKDFRVISGHYHQRQDIITGPSRKGCIGIWSYIGNPYTLNYAEADDPPKGFQVLYNDGTLEHVPTNLREHWVMELTYHNLSEGDGVFAGDAQDLVWVRIKGTKENLAKLTKSRVADDLDIPQDFRLDLIPLDTLSTYRNNASIEIKQPDLLDSIIDSISNTSDDQKARLKQLWKDLK